MAMPDYDLGTRRLGNIGNIAQRTILWDAAGREVQRSANATAGAFLAADHYYLKQDERSAHAALAECNAHVQADWVEVQKLSWKDLADAKTTPKDKMDEIVKKAQTSDAYKRLNARARRMFDESWKRKQFDYAQQANIHAFNLSKQKDADETKEIAIGIDNDVKESYLGTDEEFEEAIDIGAARKSAWSVRSSPRVKITQDISVPKVDGEAFSLDKVNVDESTNENDQVINDLNKRKFETYRLAKSEYIIDRVKTLADLAATGQAGTEDYIAVAEKTIKRYTEMGNPNGKPFLDKQQAIALKAYLAKKQQIRADVFAKKEHDGRETFRNAIASKVQDILKNGSKGEETVRSLSELSTALHEKTLPEASLFTGHEIEYDAVLNYVDGRLHSERNNYKAQQKSVQDTLLQGAKDHFAAVEDRIRRMADELHQGRKDGETADEFQTRQYLTMGMIGKYRQLDGYNVKFADEMEKLAETIATEQETEALVMIDQAFGISNGYDPQARLSVAQIKDMYEQVKIHKGDLFIRGAEVGKLPSGIKGEDYWQMREQLRAALSTLPQTSDRIEAARQWVELKKQKKTSDNAFSSMRSIAEALSIIPKIEGEEETDAWFESAKKIISDYDKAIKAISK